MPESNSSDSKLPKVPKVFRRLRNPFDKDRSRTRSVKSDDTPPTPPDPELELKLRRRRLRREEYNRRAEEHREENERLERDALRDNLPFKPLPPLPDFDSASEDERDPVASPTKNRSEQQLHSAQPPIYPNAQQQPQPSPPLSRNSSLRQHADSATPQLDPSLPAFPALQLPTQPQPQLPTQPQPQLPTQPQPQLQPQLQPQSQPPVQRKRSQHDAQLAEQFASIAFPSAYTSASRPPPPTPPPQPASSYTEPAPVGWGGVYDSMTPGQAVYGPPMNLNPSPPALTVTQVDYALSETIRRGRELAFLAVEQEESGNMGAANGGYLKALEILVPAAKQLDVGSDLNKTARMQLKQKIKREINAMMDRCENLQVFLKANGPSVPTEMPRMPGDYNGGGSGSGGNGGATIGMFPSRDMPRMPQDSGTLLMRMTSRRDVFQNASSLPPPQPPQGSVGMHHPPPVVPHFEERSLPPLDLPLIPDGAKKRGGENRPNGKGRKEHSPRCFMCEDPAQLKTRCGHTFCSNCGNQLVTVFGSCPVPGCGSQISIDTFEHILS